MAKPSLVIVTVIFTLSIVAISSTANFKQYNSAKIRNLTNIIESDKKLLCRLQEIKVINLKNKITILKERLKARKQNVTACETTLIHKNNMILNTTNTIQQKEIEISFLKANVSMLQTSLVDLNKSCSNDIESRIQSKESDYAILQNNYTELQKVVKLKDIESKKLKSVWDQLQIKSNIIIDLNNTIRDLQTLINANENDKDKYTRLQKLVELNNIEISNLRFEQRNLSTQLQSCTNENMKLKSRLIEITESLVDRTIDRTEVKCPPFDNFTGDHLIRVPTIQEPFRIPCNSDSNDKEWSVIERRLEQKLDFNRNWEQYRDGFGDLKSEFFVGLKVVHLMTSAQPHELLIRLRTKKSVKFAHYSHFEVAAEDKDFTLMSLGSYSGDAGDGMRGSEGLKFSTFDRDNDLLEDVNCAEDSMGAWWFSDCGITDLNYKHYSDIMNLMHWNNKMEPVVSIEMMIRPTE